MLRAAVFALALTLGGSVAVAQPDPGGFGGAPAEHEAMKRPEVLTGRPSGFWTSTRPANGSRYRWRIMAAGGLALAVTGLLLSRSLRRINRERAGKPAWPVSGDGAPAPTVAVDLPAAKVTRT